jgi:hypothetical protein
MIGEFLGGHRKTIVASLPGKINEELAEASGRSAKGQNGPVGALPPSDGLTHFLVSPGSRQSIA